MKQINAVIIGAGYRGKILLQLLKQMECYRVTAIFDPSATIEQQDGTAIYADGTNDYQRMIVEQKPQLVFIASPWQFHIEQSLFALRQGCHVAVEIKGGLCKQEYDGMIELARQKSLHIYPMENTVFIRENMAVYNMIAQGVLGEIIAMKGGYRHDLRKLLLDDQGVLGNAHKAESIWRSKFYTTENGDIYPTHGIAPLCMAAGIGRTCRIERLISFASKARGIAERIRQSGGKEVPISMGDIIITQMNTDNGILITLTHDTTLPRPRSLDYEIQGTKGIWNGDRHQIYIENVSPDETWEDMEPYIIAYDHPLWKEYGEKALRIDTHHKGMDYIMLQCIANDLAGISPFLILPEDLALWTSISPLSKLSIKEGRYVSMHTPQ